MKQLTKPITLDQLFADSLRAMRDPVFAASVASALRRRRILRWISFSSVTLLGLTFVWLIFTHNVPESSVQRNPGQTNQMVSGTPSQHTAPLGFPVAHLTPSFAFKVSDSLYRDKTNLDTAVAHDPALGSMWRPARWEDLVAFSKVHPIQDVIDSLPWGLKIAANEENQFWVLYQGRSTLPNDTKRHYYVAHFDHNVPQTWRVHAQIDKNLISLGSWHGAKLKILGVKRDFH